MKKVFFLIFVVLFVFGRAAGANLIVNSALDAPLNSEIRLEMNCGQSKPQIFSEDSTWNKCFRINVDDLYAGVVDGKKIQAFNAWIKIGGSGQNGEFGFAVTPDAFYKFSVQLKSDIPASRAMVSVKIMGFENDNYDKPQSLANITEIKNLSASDWNTYAGSFRTGKNTRAAVWINVFGSTQWGKDFVPLRNSWFMFDNLKVEKANDILNASVPAVKSEPSRKVYLPGVVYNKFVELKTGNPVKADTEVKVRAETGAFVLDIKCLEPEMDKVLAKVTQNDVDPWRDDVVEVFFGPVSADRKLTQLVIAAGGGRWTNAGISNNDAWTARVEKGNGFWHVEATVPYRLLGFDGKPAAGQVIDFNVARQRPHAGELSSLTFVNGNFHNQQYFGKLLPKTEKEWFDAVKAKLSEALKPIPDADSLVQELAALKMGEIAETFNAVCALEEKIKLAAFGKRIFVLSVLNPASDFHIPMLPANAMAPGETIKLRAAVNEIRPLALAITNLTGALEEYRVTLGHLNKLNAEQSGLKGMDGAIFPMEKYKLYRGIRIRESDSPKHELMFDPLEQLGTAGALIVPPREAGLLWARFDTFGVKPGKYQGTLRVIPLSVEGSMDQMTQQNYKGQTRDIAFELEVLPIELSRLPAVPFNMFSTPFNQEIFRQSQELDSLHFMISNWHITGTFSADGKLESEQTSLFDEPLSNIVRWAQAAGVSDQIHIMLGFGVYNTFQNQIIHNRFVPGSDAWKNAWKDYVKLIDRTMAKHGFDRNHYSLELWDEPAENIASLIDLVPKLALDAAPGINNAITIAYTHPEPATMLKAVPYIKTWILYESIKNPDYKVLCNAIRARRGILAIYKCSDSLSMDNYSYYRLHGWQALAEGLDALALFTLYTPIHQGIQDWRVVSGGAVIYRSGDSPVLSTRAENLRAGMTDIRYMRKLESLIPQIKDQKLAAAARELVRSAPSEVVKSTHDNRIAEQMRERIIELILKIQQESQKK